MAVDSVEQPQNGEKESAAAAAAATAAPPATAPAAPPPTVPTEPQKEPGSAEGDKAQSPEVSGARTWVAVWRQRRPRAPHQLLQPRSLRWSARYVPCSWQPMAMHRPLSP